jgi:hypothetical protein
MTSGRTLLDDVRICRLLRVALDQTEAQELLPLRLRPHRARGRRLCVSVGQGSERGRERKWQVSADPGPLRGRRPARSHGRGSALTGPFDLLPSPPPPYTQSWDAHSSRHVILNVAKVLILTVPVGHHPGRQWVRPVSGRFPSGPISHASCRSLVSVGKTSLMNQYVNKRFSNQYKATIGADLCVALPRSLVDPPLTRVSPAA